MKADLFIQQLDALISAFRAMQEEAQHDDLWDLPAPETQSLVSRVVAAIHRISGSASIYSLEVLRVIENSPILHHHTPKVIGVAKALRDDLEAGYLQSLAEIVHAEVFADFIEMATHLLNNSYKDAAAVIIGSTLESHIRKLAVKNGVPTEANGKPLKAEQLNQDLTKASVYNLLDQKNVTAWLDLRNKAAHGDYTAYTTDQVKLLLSSVQEFMTRHQA